MFRAIFAGKSAAVVAPAAAAAAAPAPDAAADPRATLCSSLPDEVYNFLLSNPERATDIAMSATQLQDPSAVRIDTAPPPAESAQASPPHPAQADSVCKRRRRSSKGQAAENGVDATEEADVQTGKRAKPSPARNYRKASEENRFLTKYPVNAGYGVRLGSAVTIATMIIQGPYPKEDRRDSKEHLRQVLSGMLNVCGASTIAAFQELGKEAELDMFAYCLQRVEPARVTLQRGVAALQKFINGSFASPTGIADEWRRKHLASAIALKLSTEVLFFMAAYFGLQKGQSILDRWKNETGGHKYPALCPTNAKANYPCKCEEDGRAVAMFVGSLFRVDARHPYKEGTGHDLLRPGTKPLARFAGTAPRYSTVAAYMLVEFWFKRSSLCPLSHEIACSTATEADIVFEKTFKM